MSDTPDTDDLYKGEWNHAFLFSTMRRLERQRDAYAETLREVLAMEPDWTVIAKRHPELGNDPTLPPA